MGTQANTVVTSPQIQQGQVRIPNPAGALAATAAAGIASGLHRAGGVQVRNPNELMATPPIPSMVEWFQSRVKKLTAQEINFMEEQVQTWKVDLAEANKDDFGFDELFDELSSDESYQQHK